METKEYKEMVRILAENGKKITCWYCIGSGKENSGENCICCEGSGVLKVQVKIVPFNGDRRNKYPLNKAG